jgi:hypothetical protein
LKVFRNKVIQVEVDGYHLEDDIKTIFYGKWREQDAVSSFYRISDSYGPPEIMIQEPEGNMVKFVFQYPVRNGSGRCHGFLEKIHKILLYRRVYYMNLGQ